VDTFEYIIICILLVMSLWTFDDIPTADNALGNSYMMLVFC